jgi:hypothetical protein
MLFTKLFRKNKLEEEIQACLDFMRGMKQDSVEYDNQIEVLTKLYKLKKEARGYSLDTLINVFGSIAGIVVIVQKERFDVVVSKALSFVWKGRV